MVSARGASAFTRVREKRQVGRACESQHGAFGWGVGVSLRTRPKPRLSARRAMPRPPAFGRTNPRMRIGPVWQNEPEGCALAPSGRTKRRMRVVWQKTNPRMRVGSVGQNEAEDARCWQNEPEGCALAPSGRTKRRMRVVWQNEPENARWHRLTERTRASWRQNWQNEPELDDRIG